MLVGLHVPTNLQMYRQKNSEKVLWRRWGGGGAIAHLPPPPPPPPGYASDIHIINTSRIQFVEPKSVISFWCRTLFSFYKLVQFFSCLYCLSVSDEIMMMDLEARSSSLVASLDGRPYSIVKGLEVDPRGNNPFSTKTPNIYSREEINLYCIMKLAT